MVTTIQIVTPGLDSNATTMAANASTIMICGKVRIFVVTELIVQAKFDGRFILQLVLWLYASCFLGTLPTRKCQHGAVTSTG